MLAAGFISWMTLSLAKIAHPHNDLPKQPQDAGAEPSH